MGEQMPTKAQAEVMEYVDALPDGHYVAAWACRRGQSWAPAHACVRRGWIKEVQDTMLLAFVTRAGRAALARYHEHHQQKGR